VFVIAFPFLLLLDLSRRSSSSLYDLFFIFDRWLGC
jgi:hypothetical protein